LIHAAKPNFPATHENIEMASLVALSGRVGREPLLVQASNGNTSIKLDGVLWIKGSGKWLANAGQEDFLVPIPLADAEESVRTGTEIAPVYVGDKKLQPSIETAMHAVLRHRIVIHLHSVNTIAWAIRLDARIRMKERLDGLNWQWIPYVGSGIPLAREIQQRETAAPESEVLVLGNHGLVICGEDCNAVETLLAEVERRLEIIPRECRDPDSTALTMISRFSQWRLPNLSAVHTLGTDAVSRRILKGGILYPCQAIFLGRTMPFLSKAVPFFDLKGSKNAERDTRPFVIVEDGGVMINKTITNTELANLMGLLQVVQRTEESTPLRYLTAAEVSSLLSDRAHSYKAIAIRSEKVSSLHYGSETARP
jgi:rhamnose utilization protein RhaD (predicted bifunctional aldolase and dehydrogenase)